MNARIFDRRLLRQPGLLLAIGLAHGLLLWQLDLGGARRASPHEGEQQRWLQLLLLREAEPAARERRPDPASRPAVLPAAQRPDGQATGAPPPVQAGDAPSGDVSVSAGPAPAVRPGSPALDLSLPPSAQRERSRPPAEIAARDPRSNSIRLTAIERLRIRMGEYECVGEQLMPDGTIRRGPGKLVQAEGGASPLNNKVVMECVL